MTRKEGIKYELGILAVVLQRVEDQSSDPLIFQEINVAIWKIYTKQVNKDVTNIREIIEDSAKIETDVKTA